VCVCVCVCILSSTPSLLFIGGSHQVLQPQLTLGANQEAPCRSLKAVGPTGRSAERAGRPNGPVGRQPKAANRPQLPPYGLVCVSSCPKVSAQPVLAGFALVLGLHLVQLSLNRCSNISYDFVLGQSVLATCILA